MEREPDGFDAIRYEENVRDESRVSSVGATVGRYVEQSHRHFWFVDAVSHVAKMRTRLGDWVWRERVGEVVLRQTSKR